MLCAADALMLMRNLVVECTNPLLKAPLAALPCQTAKLCWRHQGSQSPVVHPDWSPPCLWCFNCAASGAEKVCLLLHMSAASGKSTLNLVLVNYVQVVKFNCVSVAFTISCSVNRRMCRSHQASYRVPCLVRCLCSSCKHPGIFTLTFFTDTFLGHSPTPAAAPS